MTVPDNWEQLPTQAFGSHVGPFWRPAGGDGLQTGFLADERHGNKRGVAHGGMLATAFDVALGNACWNAVDTQPCATVQLTIQYVGALQLGEFAVIETEIVRATRSMVFARGVMRTGTRIVATADGVWKILAWRTDPPSGPPASASG